jgi:hypothetical protein
MSRVIERSYYAGMGKSLNAVLLNRIRGEYREMPGLQLTLAQACRLWQIDQPTCRAALEQLIDEAFLRRSSDGGYIALPERAKPLRADLDAAAPLRRHA